MASEPYPSSTAADVKPVKSSFSRRLSQKVKGLFSLQHEPEDREDINEILNTAYTRGIIDQETLHMVLGSISLLKKSLVISWCLVPKWTALILTSRFKN